MTSATGPARAPDLREPSPCLRTALDLPLRVELSAGGRASLDELAARVRSPGDGGVGEWIRIYELAIRCVDATLREVDEGLERTQGELLALEDLNEVRQRISQQPRREAERVRTEVRAAVQATAREWSERTRRQTDHVRTQCVGTAQQTLVLREVTASSQVELHVDDAWWQQYAEHLRGCCDEWTRTTAAGVDAALAEAIGARSRALAVRPGERLAAPNDGGVAVVTAWRQGEAPPVRRSPATSMGAAVGAYLRTNMMMLGMFSAVFMALVWLAGTTFAAEPPVGAATTPARIDGGLVRGGLMLACLPVMLVLGYRASRRKLREAQEAAQAAHREVVIKYVRLETDANLERHRQALDRGISRRSEAWAVAFEAWAAGVLAPALAAADDDAAAKIRELKARQSRLSDALLAARTVRGQLAQNVGFELRKRLRELLDLAPNPGT